MAIVNRHLEQVEATEEEKWEFAEALFGGGIREELDESEEVEEEQQESEPKEQPVGVYRLRFYSENRKAISEAKFGSEEHKMEVKSREHAVKIAKRAVAKANEDGAGIEFLHGFQTDGVDPFAPELERTCLSFEAYNEVWAELEAAKFNSQPISW